MAESHGITASTFTPGERYLLIGLVSGGLYIWDTTESRLIEHIKAHDDAIIQIVPFRDGKRFLTVGYAEYVAIWDIDNLSAPKRMEFEDAQPISAVLDSVHEHVIVVNYAEPTVLVVAASFDSSPIGTKDIDALEPVSVVFVRSSQNVVIGCRYGRIFVLDYPSLAVAHTWDWPECDGAARLVWNASAGLCLAYNYHESDLILFDPMRFRKRKNMPLKPHLVSCAEFQSDGKVLIVGTSDGLIIRVDLKFQLIDVVSGKHDAEVTAISCSDRYVFTGDWNGKGFLWESNFAADSKPISILSL